MRYLIFLIIVIGQSELFAQSENEAFRFLLPDHDAIVKLLWADINNDSLLDAVVGYKLQGQFKVTAFQNGTVEPWPIHELITTTSMDGISFQMMDYNNDGFFDVTVVNEQEYLARAYQNKRAFTFQASTGWGSREVYNRGLQYVDLNNDAVLDTIWTDGGTLSIMNHKDTTLQRINSFSVFDFDNNGFQDIVFSGVDNKNAPLTYCWYLGNDFQIIHRSNVIGLAGQIFSGDLNHDGLFDLAIAGKDALETLKTTFLLNQNQAFNTLDQAVGLDSATLLIADFNSDGLADVALSGKNSNGTKVNWIQDQFNIMTELETEIQGQAFGDYDRDGDLDWGQLKNDSLYIYQNNAITNKGPASPLQAIALPVGEYTFFYWKRPLDDHTNSNSITYDLKVYLGDSTFRSADFDSDHGHRALVSHGNAGTNNFALLQINGDFDFEIQSIDNALVPDPNAICKGGVSVCANAATEKIQACGEAPVQLTPAAPQAMWFSVSKGYLGTGDSFTYESGETDMVFSFNPGNNLSCASLKTFDIQVSEGQDISLEHVRYDCEGRNITLEVEPGWSNIQWTNNFNNEVVSASSLVHAFEKPILFTANAMNSYGCKLIETFDLRISRPNLQLNGVHFQIAKGGSVQFEAEGGDFYEWTPPTGLSNNQIANPLASPEATTEYTVTALDSLGCSAKANVLVEVSEEAFIPTLFTPNGDNRNDQLKIYGLTQVSGFHFTIFNREGMRIYETTSVSEATQSGWSGSVNGLAQPPGTYYWKIEGRMSKGDLLLNGKKEGTILLVR